MTEEANHMRITTPSGTNLQFDNEPKHKITCDDGDASYPGMHMLAGQICWIPRFETIKGTLVFDGSLVPPYGLLKRSIVMEIEKGRVVDIRGGE